MRKKVLLEPASPGNVIVHYHIMKNAGSTIDSILEREFGDDFYDVHRANEAGSIDGADLARFLECVPTARAVTSHHLAYPVPEIAAMTVFDCCPLRQPLDRLESLYNFMRATRPANPVGELAVRSDLAAFLKTLLDRLPNYVYNVQTVMLANRGRFRAMSEDDLERAIAAVRRSAMPAVVDRLAESLTVAEYFLGPAFPDLQLHYTIQNMTRDPRTPLAERREVFRKRCGDVVFDQVRAMNEFDARLCEAANGELDRRIAMVPQFNERLAGFRERCESRQGAAAPIRRAVGNGTF